TRRWLIASVIVPLVGILLPVVVLLVQGGGSGQASASGRKSVAGAAVICSPSSVRSLSVSLSHGSC
ncbi:hypothetical protein KBZ21_50725, partial [Streptomyces sp. A73]|nr:hypothetical protein [Streptomyces sp. A73]